MGCSFLYFFTSCWPLPPTIRSTYLIFATNQSLWSSQCFRASPTAHWYTYYLPAVKSFQTSHTCKLSFKPLHTYVKKLKLLNKTWFKSPREMISEFLWGIAAFYWQYKETWCVFRASGLWPVKCIRQSEALHSFSRLCEISSMNGFLHGLNVGNSRWNM